MVSHYPAKFDGYRHSGSGDINILANTVLLPQTQNTRSCICRSISVITLSKAHGMSCSARVSNKNLRNNFYRSFF